MFMCSFLLSRPRPKCLAQETPTKIPVDLMRFEPRTSRPRVQHLTTEPPRTLHKLMTAAIFTLRVSGILDGPGHQDNISK